MNNFDNKWHEKNRPWFIVAIPLLLFIIAIGGIMVNTAKESPNEIMPPEQNGFVGKANALLNNLLTDSSLVDNSVTRIQNIRDLNRKYKALIFAMPYENLNAMREDIRLVGIRPEMIREEKDKIFYYNSNLPSLLERQSKDLGEKLFKIKSRYTNSGTNIEKIEVIRSMFKVALIKDPWSGKILAAPNSLFEDSTCLYLSYGTTIVPLKVFQQAPTNDHYATLDVNTSEENIKFRNAPIDYYQYYRHTFMGNRFNRFIFHDNRLPHHTAELFIKCLSPANQDEQPRVELYLNNGLACTVFRQGYEHIDISPSNHESAKRKSVTFQNGMKIRLRVGNNNQIAEFSITKENPALTLSSLIRSHSGTSRAFASNQADLFTKQILRGLSSNLSNTKYDRDVQLTIDPLLSKEFEHELSNYMAQLKENLRNQSQRNEHWDISLTVMDIATGNIIAMPYCNDANNNLPNKMALTRKNPGLERRYIGSTFKPLLTLAAVQTNPSLLRLNTRGKVSLSGEQHTFFGCPTKGWANPEHWVGCDMRNFIASSDDVYPVALAALSLNNYPDNQDISNINNIRRNFGFDSFFERSGRDNIFIGNRSASGFEFFSILDALYAINSYDEIDEDSVVMSNYLWRNLHLKDQDYFGLSEVSPEPTVMRYDLMANQIMRGELVPWVLGQGNNYWNCAKLAEAWARMLGKRAVMASFVKDPEGKKAISLIDPIYDIKNRYNQEWSRERINNTWNIMLRILQDAQALPGTLRPIYDNVSALNHRLNYSDNDRRRLVLFGKTGTPNEYFQRTATISGRRTYIDLGMFCLGLMSQESYSELLSNSDATPKGIVCILRVTRQYPSSTSAPGLSSGNAKRFFDVDRLEKLYYMTRNYFN